MKRRTIANIIRSADIQKINDFILEISAISPTDEETRLLHDVIMTLKEERIEMQFIVYTYLTNGCSITNAAKALRVSNQTIGLYLKEYRDRIKSRFSKRWKEYNIWLASLEEPTLNEKIRHYDKRRIIGSGESTSNDFYNLC